MFHTTRLALPGDAGERLGPDHQHRAAPTASSPRPTSRAYVAAKHGVAGFTKTVALEAARDGVTVNCISPGYVWTTLVENQIPDTMKARGLTREQVMNDVLLAAQPTKRFVTPEEVAAWRCSCAATTPPRSPAPTSAWTAAGRRNSAVHAMIARLRRFAGCSSLALAACAPLRAAVRGHRRIPTATGARSPPAMTASGCATGARLRRGAGPGARRPAMPPRSPREGALLEPDAALGGGPIPNGDYRCRVIKLGAKSPGMLDYVAYPAFACRIAAGAASLQGFAKLTGSQRPVGLIFPATRCARSSSARWCSATKRGRCNMAATPTATSPPSSSASAPTAGGW